MSPHEVSRDNEWLETDGLGGFASGTTSAVNTRRYHALLCCANEPPADRYVLVNGCALWLETPSGVRQLSEHDYAPAFTHQRDVRLQTFSAEPWPRFRYELGGGPTLEHEIIAVKGLPVVLVSWRFDVPLPGWRLCLRPLLSGRPFHALHRENPRFDFNAAIAGERVALAPYPTLPGVFWLANGNYEHAPDWYRNFAYVRERERGLDHLEDLASPGVLSFDLANPEVNWLLFADTPATRSFSARASAQELAARIRERERERREQFTSPLVRAADAYIVRRGKGKTIIAGYPWFGDWGRDTMIAVRGLCLATERHHDAFQILQTWSNALDQGLLPNRFHDATADGADYNSVDAALWFIVAAGELLDSTALLSEREQQSLIQTICAIIDRYAAGTQHGIQRDTDGLLRAGAPGVQLTWMDARIGHHIVTPRRGKPVEVQALWLNALAIAKRLTGAYGAWLEQGLASFAARFFDAARGCLFDVVDVDQQPALLDRSIRPNQVYAVGGLPLALLDPERCRSVLEVVERELWTPLGLRTLSPHDPAYVPHYRGGVAERDGAYHQGTVWPYLAGPFIEAWVKSRGATPAAKREARQRFLEPLLLQLTQGGIGHVNECADGDPPHHLGGCPFQAWSLGELLRLEHGVLTADALADQPPGNVVFPAFAQ